MFLVHKLWMQFQALEACSAQCQISLKRTGRMSECFVVKSHLFSFLALKSPIISQSRNLTIEILFNTLPPLFPTNPNPYKYTEKIRLQFSIYPSTFGFVISLSLNRYQWSFRVWISALERWRSSVSLEEPCQEDLWVLCILLFVFVLCNMAKQQLHKNTTLSRLTYGFSWKGTTL